MCCPVDNSELVIHALSTEGDDVVNGVIECQSCSDLWTVIYGIPRFVSAASVDLDLDLAFVSDNRKALESQKQGLPGRIEKKIKAIVRHAGEADNDWNREEMLFWEKDYYTRFHNDVTNRKTYNRLLPRKRFLIDPLSGKDIKTVLEIGCGTCGTINQLPDFIEGKHYIGTDLSFNALRTGRKFVPGDFVMCEASKLPFKEGVLDLLLSFGVLHHLEEKQEVLAQLFSKLKKGGHLGFGEKFKGKIDFGKSKFLRMVKDLVKTEEHRAEGHEEYIEEERAIVISRNYGEIIAKRYGYSVLRIVLVKLFMEILKLDNRFLTRMIIGLDYFFIDILSFISPLFHGSSLILLVKKTR